MHVHYSQRLSFVFILRSLSCVTVCNKCFWHSTKNTDASTSTEHNEPDECAVSSQVSREERVIVRMKFIFNLLRNRIYVTSVCVYTQTNCLEGENVKPTAFTPDLSTDHFKHFTLLVDIHTHTHTHTHTQMEPTSRACLDSGLCTQTGGAGNQTTDLLISRRPAHLTLTIKLP